MKKGTLLNIMFILIALALVLFVLFFVLGNGASSKSSDSVLEQQRIIECAEGLYDDAKSDGIEFSSQCLGVCEDYSVDIVHVPREESDNLEENQCSEFRNGETSHFIELDKNGEVVRIV